MDETTGFSDPVSFQSLLPDSLLRSVIVLIVFSGREV
jgi:hypothetical protein